MQSGKNESVATAWIHYTNKFEIWFDWDIVTQKKKKQTFQWFDQYFVEHFNSMEAFVVSIQLNWVLLSSKSKITSKFSYCLYDIIRYIECIIQYICWFAAVCCFESEVIYKISLINWIYINLIKMWILFSGPLV